LQDAFTPNWLNEERMVERLHQPLNDYFEKVFWPRLRLKNSARTERLYRLTLARFGEYLGRLPLVSDLNDDTLIGFLGSRIDAGLAPRTAGKDRWCLMAIANAAARKRHIPEFLDVPPIDAPDVSPDAWKAGDLKKLLDACRESVGMLGQALARDWWQAYHYTALVTGERTEAMLKTEWSMLDTATGWLRLPATIRKGRKKPADYRLPDVVMAYVMRLHGRTERFIFETPWKWPKTGIVPQSFYNAYTRLLKRAGLPTTRKFKPQRMRRTFASYLEAAGGNATEALGHSSRRVTKQSYLDPTIVGGVTPAQQIVAAYNFLR
jgi:integrase